MSNTAEQPSQGTHVFRVDQFVVPATAREEFLSRITDTHAVLRQQEGFVRDNLLEQAAGEDEIHIVTIAEWRGQEYIEAAKAAVTAMREGSGFDPQEMLQRLGIKADFGNYMAVDG